MATSFEEVRDIFLNKIEDCNYLEYTEEELNKELALKVKSVLAKYITEDEVTFDENTNLFSRDLSQLEIETIALGLLSEWLSPKIYRLSLVEQSLSSNEWNMTSQANHLKELRNLQKATKDEMRYWNNRINFIKYGNKIKKNCGKK